MLHLLALRLFLFVFCIISEHAHRLPPNFHQWLDFLSYKLQDILSTLTFDRFKLSFHLFTLSHHFSWHLLSSLWYEALFFEQLNWFQAFLGQEFDLSYWFSFFREFLLECFNQLLICFILFNIFNFVIWVLLLVAIWMFILSVYVTTAGLYTRISVLFTFVEVVELFVFCWFFKSGLKLCD